MALRGEEWKAQLKVWAERRKEIIERRKNGETFDQIAKDFDITRQRVMQIVEGGKVN